MVHGKLKEKRKKKYQRLVHVCICLIVIILGNPKIEIVYDNLGTYLFHFNHKYLHQLNGRIELLKIYIVPIIYIGDETTIGNKVGSFQKMIWVFLGESS